MEAKGIIKYFLLCGAALFTALSGAILIVLSILTGQSSGVGIEPLRFLLVLAFCYLLSLGNTVRKVSSIPVALGRAIHAVCYVGGFLGFLLLFEVQPSTAAILTLIFAFIYAPIVIISAMRSKGKAKVKSPAHSDSTDKRTTAKKTKKEKENKPYESMFS